MAHSIKAACSQTQRSTTRKKVANKMPCPWVHSYDAEHQTDWSDAASRLRQQHNSTAYVWQFASPLDDRDEGSISATALRTSDLDRALSCLPNAGPIILKQLRFFRRVCSCRHEADGLLEATGNVRCETDRVVSVQPLSPAFPSLLL